MGFALKRSTRPYKIIGYSLLTSAAIGFRIPVFAEMENPRVFYVQDVDELTGLIRRFLVLDNPEHDFLYSNGPMAIVGDKQFFGFEVAPQDVRFGTLETLAPILRPLAINGFSDRTLALQISELVGTDQEKKEARLQMRATLASDFGETVARSFYEGSVLRSVLWANLILATRDKGVARRILEQRSQLAAEITLSGGLDLNLNALSLADRNAIDLDRVINGIHREFDTSIGRLNKVPPKGAYDAHDAAKIQSQVETILREVRSSGRQEERVSIFFRSILVDRSIGLTAVLQYKNDRGSLANWALNEVRSRLVHDSQQTVSDELFIASLVPKLFTRQFTLSRGELLFYLARHLARWPHINDAIQSTLNKTRSIFVNNWRENIQAMLTDARPDRKASV